MNSLKQEVSDESMNNLTVACGSQSLRLKRIQRSGKGTMDTSDFLKGFKLPTGTNLLNGKI